MSAFSAAIPHRFIRASAGTGKTYALVQHYLWLIEHHGLEPRQIVVITFTVRAAAELRQRIRAALEGSRASNKILGQLASAPITNFHGLCLGVLGEVLGPERQAEHAPGILGETGEKALFGAAAEQAWFSSDPRLHDAVVALAPHMPLGSRGIFSLWSMISRMREDGATLVPGFFGDYDPQGTIERHHEFLSQLRARLLTTDSSFLNTRVASEQFRAFVESPVPSPTSPPSLWYQQWVAAFSCLKRNSKIREIYSAHDQTEVLLRTQRALAAALCQELAAPLELLVKTAFDLYTQKKQQLKTRDFVDIIGDVVETMRKRRAAHLRVRQRFAAVLVDEAQDTNGLQRNLIELLVGFCGPAAANQHGAPAASHLAVVGDAKQSIYNFRGADIENFSRLEDSVCANGGRSESLCISRRSTAQVVEGINALGHHLLEDQYEPLTALKTDVESKKSTSSPDDSTAFLWMSCVGDGDVGQKMAEEAQVVANYVSDRIQAGIQAEAIGVLLPFGQYAENFVAALRSRNIEVTAQATAELFAQDSIRDFLALLAWLDEPQRELDAAIALRSPYFALSDTELLTLFGAAGRQQGMLEQFCRHAFAHAPHPTVQWAAQRYVALRQDIQQLPLADGVAAVACALDLEALWRACPLGGQKRANFEELFALAAKADEAGCHRLVSFVEQLRHHHAAGLAYREGWQPQLKGGGVRVMTVHASKGLEFDEVILADIGRSPRAFADCYGYARGVGATFFPHQDAERQISDRAALVCDTLSASQASERSRSMYVAVSRGKQRVAIVAKSPEKLGKKAWGKELADWATSDAAQDVLCQTRGDARPLMARQPEETSQIASAPAPATQSRDTKWIPCTSTVELRLTATSLAKQLAGIGHFDESTPDAPGFEREPSHPLRLSRRWQGDLMHRVLRHAGTLAPNLDAAGCRAFVHSSMAHLGFDSEDEAVAVVTEGLVHFIQSPLARSLRQTPAEARLEELPFCRRHLHPQASIEVAGQMDLVMVNDEGITLVDYKLTESPRRHAVYHAQLMIYAWALWDQFSGLETRPLTAKLIYLDTATAHAFTIDASMRLQVTRCLDAIAQSGGGVAA